MKIYCESCNGTGKMMHGWTSCNNCWGKGYTEDKTAEIKIEEVEKPWGSQLKFAVPPEGENEPSVDVVDEIRDEVMGYLDIRIDKNRKQQESTNPMSEVGLAMMIQDEEFIKLDIENIFNKYQSRG